MKVEDINICILRIEGTNNEQETCLAFKRLGAKPELVHLKQLTGEVAEARRRNLFDYQCLMIPGGFSSGDYVRAGAILAARMKSTMKDDLTEFAGAGYPIGGICNGFQVLVELGLLPAFDETMTDCPEACLTTNDSAKFECRPTLLRHENNGNCVFTGRIPEKEILLMPSAHAEGKIVFSPQEQERYLQRLIDNDQVVFRYVSPEGDYAGYPWNPNGSLYNIAGICNPEGNVFGMMPHPERVFFGHQHPDWTRIDKENGDGRVIFESVLGYIREKF
ncbi:MAG: phosphoribosylformylglycinamidine synthase subunit PurQ [Methanosarcinales archaeon Met12]|nr:MAG: phosphoribosylformylglycinamidine synthase subunit PurQ [Methanosarcinales archaeon Met12]